MASQHLAMIAEDVIRSRRPVDAGLLTKVRQELLGGSKNN